MASCAELCSSLASLTSNQGGPLVGNNSSHFSSLQDALLRNIKWAPASTLHAGLSPFCCSMAIALTEELAPVLAQDSLLSSQAVPMIDEAECINSLAAEIQECSHAKDLATGEEIHAHIIGCGLDFDRYLGNLLVLMYGSCSSIESAEAVFHKIPSPNIYSANIMLNAYVTNRDLLKARILFDSMPQRNGASWNAIISGLAKNGCGEDALQYYRDMLTEGFHPNVITCVSAIDACADATALSAGMELHSTVVACGFFDMIMGTALINMYGQCGSLEDARDIYRKFPQHDVFSWSAMIAACVNNGCSEEALHMFDQMPNQGLKPSRSTFLSMLNACGNLIALQKGYEIHVQMLSLSIEADVKVENALINMYCRCQSLLDGIVVFHRMSQRNIITWSTMIAAHLGNNKNEEAIDLFYQMQTDCIFPNIFTISIVFDVCTSLQALEEGQCVYNYSVCLGIELDFIAAIALINMYGKCGRLEDARAVFCSFEEHGVLVWNAMISAYATNGQDKEARMLFEEMQAKGVEPSKATFKIIEGLHTVHGGQEYV